MNNILRIRNIEKYYGNRTNLTKAIDNISFDVNEGEFVAIMGASGSGKTTTSQLYFNYRQGFPPVISMLKAMILRS